MRYSKLKYTVFLHFWQNVFLIHFLNGYSKLITAVASLNRGALIMDTQDFNNHCSNRDVSFSASFQSMLILMQQHVNSNVKFNEMLF